MKLFFRFVLVIVGLFIALAGAEFILRQYAKFNEEKRLREFETSHKSLLPEKRYPDNSPVGRPIAYWDPYIGFRYLPSQKVLNRTIDKFGFNNKSWSKVKPASAIRIILMGGSVAEGLADSETISKFLEDELKKN